MASPPRRTQREEERRLNLRTLAIASVAAATAAVVTSRLWFAGTWIAAALTPVIVAVVSELLHRPTAKIASKLTTDRPALPPPVDAPAPPPSSAPPPGPMRVYRSGSAPAPTRRRKLALGLAVGTGLLGFLIAAVVLTVPELIAGGSIGKTDGRTTLFGGKQRDRDQQTPAETTTERESAPEDRERTTPEQTTPEEQPTVTETVPEEVPPAGEPVPTTPTTPTPAEP